MINNGICIECDGQMYFNPVPFAIFDYMEMSMTQLLNTNTCMHQRLTTYEQMCENQIEPPKPSKPIVPSVLRKEAYSFKPKDVQRE